MKIDPPERYERLEALRGAAAMAVALGHSFMVLRMSGESADAAFWLMRIFNGHAAVIIFFVLSGFVLGLSLRRDTDPFWRKWVCFSIRRIWRIWPAYAVSGFLIWTVLVIFHSPHAFDTASDWFNDFHRQRPGWSSLATNTFFMDVAVNPVTWTLTIEIVCSLLLPFLHWITERWAKFGVALVVLVTVGLEIGIRPEFRGTMAWYSYLWLFYCGYLVSGPAAAFFDRLNHQVRLAASLSIVALIVLLMAQSLFGTGRLRNLVEGVSAVWLIAAIARQKSWRALKILDWPIARFYGRISYSFYLWHLPVLLLFARYSLSKWSSPMAAQPLLACALLSVSSVACCTAITFLSYRFVELPFIAFSKAICKQVRV